jgi:hypothetical protein
MKETYNSSEPIHRGVAAIAAYWSTLGTENTQLADDLLLKAIIFSQEMHQLGLYISPVSIQDWQLFSHSEGFSLVPDRTSLDALINSRNFPLLSHEQIAIIHQLEITSFGLSTGLGELIDFARLGVTQITGYDPDIISASNLNRIPYTTLHDVSQPKAEHATNILSAINPYIQIECHKSIPTDEEIITTLTESDLVFEHTDDLAFKIKLRQLQKQVFQETGRAGLIVMGTNMDQSPVVSIETGEDPIFNISPEKWSLIESLEEPKKALMLLQYIISAPIPPRQLANLVLRLNGVQGHTHLAQTGHNASLTAGIATEFTLQYVLGQTSEKRKVFLTTDLQTDPDPNGSLLSELSLILPKVFSGQLTLNAALENYIHSLGLDWLPGQEVTLKVEK